MRLRGALVMALRFYSRVPVSRLPHEVPSLSRIAPVLPIASFALALPPALLLVGLGLLHMPAMVAACLAVALFVLLGGAMVEDATADAADGLFGGHSPERRMEIFRDSRIGAYGATAVGLLLLTRIAALGALQESSVAASAAGFMAASIFSRSGALWLSHALPPARADGLSAGAGQVSLGRFLAGAGLAAAIGGTLILPVVGAAGIVAIILTLAALAWFWGHLCMRKVGGQTGDLVGALQGLLEIAALIAIILLAGP